MTRSLLCVAAALAFAVSLPAYLCPAVAQESAGAEATADSSQSADASADTSGSADAQSSGTQADSQASSSTDASSDQSATADSGSAQTSSSESASTDASSSQSSQTDSQSQSDSPSLPPPSQTDANADADADADANVDANATQTQDQAQTSQDQQTQQTDAGRDASARGQVDAQADARVQRRAGADARGRDGRNQEIRRGIRFGRANNRGLTINFIQQNSVFHHSGLRRGDVIISLRGRPVRSEADFIRWMAFHPGDRVPVIVLRDGREQTVYIEYDQDVYADQPYDQAGGYAYLGVNFDPQVRNAAVVRNVTPGSPAEQAGLQPGDLIVALNGQEVRSHQEAIGVIRSMQPGDRLSIAFERRMQNETEAVLAGRPGEPIRTATYDSDIRVDRRSLPPQDNRRVDVEIDANNRPIQDRDRDANRDNDRPLLQRILD